MLEGYQLLCFDHFHHFNHGSPLFYLFDWFLKSVWSVWSMFSPHFEHFDFVWDCCSASIAGWQGVDAGLAGRHLRWRNAHLHRVIFREVCQVLTFIYILHCLHPNLTCVFYYALLCHSTNRTPQQRPDMSRVGWFRSESCLKLKDCRSANEARTCSLNMPTIGEMIMYLQLFTFWKLICWYWRCSWKSHHPTLIPP